MEQRPAKRFRPISSPDWRDATGTWLYEALGMSEISTYISCRPGEPIRPGSPGRPQTRPPHRHSAH